MGERPLHTQRTGVIFLGLALATNFVPWMELLAERTARADFVVATEFAIAFGACFLAAALVYGSWLFARRAPQPSHPVILRPRIVGLRLAILAAAANLALTAMIVSVGADRFPGPVSEGQFFEAVWFLLVLPAQTAAAFCKGRASTPLSRPIAATG